MRPRPIRFLTPATAVGAVGTIAVGMVQGLAGASLVNAIIILATGLASAVTLSAGLAWAERDERRSVAMLVLLSMVFSALGIWFSEGRAFTMAMPTVSCAVLYLTARSTFALSLVFVAEYFVMVLLRGDPVLQFVGSGLSISSAFAFVGIFTLFAKRERYARREVERLSAQLEELAVVKERNRIARELHDSLGHVLTVANVQIEGMRASPDGREERLQRVQDLLKTGLHDLRRTVSAWREESPAQFPTALAELLAQSEAAGLRVAFSTQGTPRALPVDVGFTLYRGAQEALTNVHRHSQATSVAVKLDYGTDAIRLSIADDGVGADLVLGNGLQGLQERLQSLSGSLSVAAAQPRGVALTLMVPR